MNLNIDKLERIKLVIESDLDCEDMLYQIKRIANERPREQRILPPRYNLNEIEQQIIEHSGISMELICKKTKDREIVEIRQMAHYKARLLTGNGPSIIGRRFGDKDHSTVIHSYKTIQNLLDTDRRFREAHEIFLTT